MAAPIKFMPPKVPYHIEGDHIVSDGDIRGHVTGTMMGGIIGVSPWSTPFQVACDILGLATKDISDSPAVKAGKALESVVIDYMEDTYPDKGEFIPAEMIYDKREGDHASWTSDFEDPIFAGHVDGIVMTPEGDQYILEVKTSSNMDAWVDGVPSYYYWQVALYNHFITKQDKAYVALGVMDAAALKNPLTWVPCKDNAGLFEVPIDQKGVDTVLEVVKEWYNTYIAKGITPDYDPSNPRDVEYYQHLVNLTMEESGIQDKIEELADVRRQIDEYEAGAAVLYARKEELTKDVREYMLGHDADRIESSSGLYSAVVTESRRSKIDPILLRDAGIDPMPFTVETVSKSFTIKLNKQKEIE